jgi:hypothetical protein
MAIDTVEQGAWDISVRTDSMSDIHALFDRGLWAQLKLLGKVFGPVPDIPENQSLRGALDRLAVSEVRMYRAAGQSRALMQEVTRKKVANY